MKIPQQKGTIMSPQPETLSVVADLPTTSRLAKLPVKKVLAAATVAAVALLAVAYAKDHVDVDVEPTDETR
jgi:hypothetical protein